MKHITTGVVTVILIVLFLVAAMTLTTRQQKTTEVNTALQASVKTAVTNIMTNRQYTINDNEEFVADLCQMLMQDINTGAEDNKDDNIKLKVEIAGVDYEKGLLSVRVTEEYSFPMRGKGTTSCGYTVVFDQESAVVDNRVVTLKDKAGNVYKEIKTKKGSEIKISVPPNTKWQSGSKTYTPDGSNLITVMVTDNTTITQK